MAEKQLLVLFLIAEGGPCRVGVHVAMYVHHAKCSLIKSVLPEKGLFPSSVSSGDTIFHITGISEELIMTDAWIFFF